MSLPQIALTIAGFDPSSGAGATADLQVFRTHGLYGISCLTALTVQSTRGVRRVEPIDAGLLAEMLDFLAEDLPPHGVKIGMLATASICRVVADFIARLRAENPIPVIIDPVLRSSSGHALLDPEGIEILRNRLFPQAICITPNRQELAVLLDRPVIDRPVIDGEELEAAAAALLHQTGVGSVLVTGGDAAKPDDLLVQSGVPALWLRGRHIETTSTHGTGCAFSSALLSGLVSGSALPEAARAAKHYVQQALISAPRLGSGRGPLDLAPPLQRPR